MHITSLLLGSSADWINYRRSNQIDPHVHVFSAVDNLTYAILEALARKVETFPLGLFPHSSQCPPPNVKWSSTVSRLASPHPDKPEEYHQAPVIRFHPEFPETVLFTPPTLLEGVRLPRHFRPGQGRFGPLTAPALRQTAEPRASIGSAACSPGRHTVASSWQTMGYATLIRPTPSFW